METEDMVSRVKLAKLTVAFEQDSSEKIIESLLETEGDVNYAISFSENLKSVNHRLQPGTILHQMGKLNEIKISKVLNLLIKHGADITVKNNQGQTALHSEFTYQYKNSSNCSFDSPIINALLTAHVEHKIRRNPRDDNGITHFHIACMTKHVKAIDFFLSTSQFYEQQLISRESSIFPGCSALHLAVNCRSVETVKKLLDYGANAYLKDTEGLTPVQNLIKRNLAIANWETSGDYKDLAPEYRVNQEIIRMLLMGTSVNNNSNNIASQIVTDEHGFSNFHAACTLDDITIAKNLLLCIQDVNLAINVNSSFYPGYTPLHFAAHFSIDLVTLLILRKGNIMAKDAKGLTPLDICTQRYSIEKIVHILATDSVWNILKNVVMSDKVTSLINVFCAMQSKTSYSLFLKQLKDINCFVDDNSRWFPGYTILHFAVLFSDQVQARARTALLQSKSNKDENWPKLKMIQECMAHGADFTIQDSRGSTPLHLAFHSQKQSILDILLDHGHKLINPIDSRNVSHLHIVCSKGAQGTVQNLILEGGVDVNLATNSSIRFVRIRQKNSSVFYIPAGCTPLHVAVTSSEIEVIKFLVHHGADMNARNKDGWTPVHMVMLLSMPDKIGKALLSLTANLKERVVDDIGLSHLHVACHVDCLRAVKKLIKLGANVNVTVKCNSELRDNKYSQHYCESNCQLLCQNTYAGFTPLHFALQRGSTKIVNELLEAGADVLAKNSKGISPLHEILSTGKESKFFDQIVAYLRSNKDLQNRLIEDSGITMLHISAYLMDDTDVAKLIINGVDVNAKVYSDSKIWPGYTPLHNWVDGSLEHIYAEEKVNNTLKLLLDAGADITLANSNLDTPLQSFSYSNIWINAPDVLSIGRMLLNTQKDFGVNPVNATGVSHFHIAVRMYDVEIAEKFLKKGADVNQQIDYFSDDDHHVERPGCTPLHLVAYCDSIDLNESLPARMEMIELLLKYGADVNTRDVFGNTPLHAAVGSGLMRDQIGEKIVRAGGKINAANNAGETPFALLLKSGKVSPEEVEFFLQKGCHINVYNSVDHTGFLALPLSVLQSKKQANDVYKLFFKNPDIKKVDAIGRTAIHNVVSLQMNRERYLVRQVYNDLIKRFVKLGCDIDAQHLTGKTALHKAAEFKNRHAVLALLMNGADINILTKSGKSAFDYSLEACGCSVRKNNHYHVDLVFEILKHIQSMQLAGLHVSKHNVNLIEKALRRCGTTPPILTLVKTEIDKTKQLFIATSSPLSLFDFLSETGAVAAYPTMSRVNRRIVDKYFNMKNKVLEYLDDVVRSLLKLQYRKIVKRSALFKFGIDSLRNLSGIPLPELVCENLMRYLSFTDVQNLVATTKN